MARGGLVQNGVRPDQLKGNSAFADTSLRYQEGNRWIPRNRRVSIVVKSRTAETARSKDVTRTIC
jgi:hypothetical protein